MSTIVNKTNFPPDGIYNMPDGTTIDNDPIIVEEDGTLSNEGSVTIQNSRNEGGAVVSTGKIVLDGATFDNNSYNDDDKYNFEDGGALRLYESSETTISNSTFSNNVTRSHYKKDESKCGGGAIRVGEGDSTLILTNVVFNNNSEGGDGGGGAIKLNQGTTATITGCEFNENSCYGWGGVYFSGGAIFALGANLTLNDVSFTGNYTHVKAGAIYGDSLSTVTITNATFESNYSDDGGAIENYNEGTMTITDTTFTGNSAVDGVGGAILNRKGSTLNLANVVFDGNTAKDHGGAIYNDGCTVNLTGKVTLATSSDTIYNDGGILNWDLRGEEKGCIEGYQYVVNANSYKQLITIDNAPTSTLEKTVIATGDFSGKSKFCNFVLTNFSKEESDKTITVDGNAVNCNGRYYCLSSGSDAETGLDTITLTAFTAPAGGVLVTTGPVWFNADSTITIEGLAIGMMTEVKISGYGADVTAPVENKKFSCTLAYAGETKGTEITVTGLKDGTQLGTAGKYTLKVDTIIPTVGIATYEGDSKFVDTNGTTWFKQDDATAALNVEITDVTSGLGIVTFNGIRYDAENKKFAIDTTEETTAAEQAIQAYDKARNLNDTVKAGAYSVDGTGPVAENVSVSNACEIAEGVYWIQKGASSTVSATVTDAGSGLKEVSFSGSTVTGSESLYTKAYDTAAEHELGAYVIAATDNVGNKSEKTLMIGVDGTGPVIAITRDPSITEFLYPDSITVTAVAADALSGLDKITYSIDGGAAQDYTTAVTVTENCSIAFTAYDKVGNYTSKSILITDLSPITITALNQTKIYDGTTDVDQTKYTYTDGVLLAGDVLSVTLATDDFAVSDNPGTVSVASYKVMRGDTDVTLLYKFADSVDGTLTVTPITDVITITADNAAKAYDGTSLTNDAYSFTDGILVPGDELIVTVAGSITDAGSIANTVTEYAVMHGDKDVTDCYTVNTVGGTLTVTPRNVTLISDSDKKIYDGTALTTDSVSEIGGFAKGEGATFYVTGSQTEIGTSTNTLSYVLNENTKAENYSIAVNEGTLTVLADAITDYNASGKSDIVQVLNNGLIYITYDTEAGYVKSEALNNVNGWDVTEFRRDLTGDKVADIQMTKDAGNGTTWVATLRNDYLKDGAITLNYQFIGAYNNELWRYLGSADVNGDGKAEVLMEQTKTGTDGAYRHVAAWVTDSEGKWVDNEWVGSIHKGVFDVAGTADVDGNGTDNVILRRADGSMAYWSEKGTNEVIEIADAEKSVLINSGDFDGDHADDLLFTNIYGDFFTWTNIAGELSNVKIGNIDDLGGTWALAGAGDYNGDGKDELLWCDGTSTAYSEANKENFKNLMVIA